MLGPGTSDTGTLTDASTTEGAGTGARADQGNGLQSRKAAGSNPARCSTDRAIARVGAGDCPLPWSDHGRSGTRSHTRGS